MQKWGASDRALYLAAEKTVEMTIRSNSSIVGLAAIAVTIYFESHGQPLAGQCFIWSVLALAAPVGVAVVTGGEFLRAWFWVALLTTASLHIVLLWSVWGKMPFPKVSVVIVFGFIEAVILTVVCAQIKQCIGSPKAQ